mgnify:CR=1 FL=1
MTPSSVFSSAFSRMSLLALALSWFSAAPALAASDAPLATAAAQAAGSARAVSYDGVVEAVRQTQIAAQVPGAVVELAVHAGDRVTAGQLLVRIDARTADQGAVASAAQVQAGRANLAVAQGEVERQQQLHAKKYISAAALERAEGQLKAARAQVDAQSAQAGAARTGAGLHTVRAPYAGVVAEVPVQLGDMAMPGRPLLTLYDPAALRVTASVPQTSVTKLAGATPGAAQVRIELPGLPADQQPQATRVQLLPTVDAGTHTQQLRAEFPAQFAHAVPGMFARLWLAAAPADPQAADAAKASVTVPLKSVLRRGEMTGVYVPDAQGRPLLRQVRLGPVAGDRVEILSGVAPGEAVVLDPLAVGSAR